MGGSVSARTLGERGFASRYRDVSVLGIGGMGEVRLCEDGAIGREIAVKAIRNDHAGSEGIRERFLREARVQAQLEHPAIVPVYDIGVNDLGQEFFTMRRVSGTTLEDALHELREVPERASRWPRGKLLGILRQVALAVEYAHSRGVVHRDLKPANVMVGDFGEVYVLDWGLAKILRSTSSSASEGESFDVSSSTRVGEILGSPGYMAPEQIGSADTADERSDVYSLGAMLFEILSLEPLHVGSTTAQILRSTQIGADARPGIRAPTRDVPPELDAVCARAAEHDPVRRFQSVHEFTAALEGYLEGDRDLEARRKLAAQHAATAEAALGRALARGADSNMERAVALGEAGRALALDPSRPAALATVVRLLEEPPDEVPEEVKKDLEDQDAAVFHSVAKRGAAAFTVLLACCGLMLWLGVRSWAGFSAIVVSIVVAIAASLWAVVTRRRATAALLLIVCALAVAIAAASGVLGPLILVPTLATCLVGSASATARPNWERALALGVSVGALVIPLALEWLRIMPPSYQTQGELFCAASSILVVSNVATAQVALIVTSLAAIVVCATQVWSAVDTVVATRLRLGLQTWQLRQLARVGERTVG